MVSLKASALLILSSLKMPVAAAAISSMAAVPWIAITVFLTPALPKTSAKKAAFLLASATLSVALKKSINNFSVDFKLPSESLSETPNVSRAIFASPTPVAASPVILANTIIDLLNSSVLRPAC